MNREMVRLDYSSPSPSITVTVASILTLFSSLGSSQDCEMKPNNYCGDAVNSKYRTADGSCNNVAGDDPDKAKWGQVSTCYPRLLNPQYGDYWGDEIRLAADGSTLPNPRKISNAFCAQKTYKPDPVWSQGLMNWGQILANEVTYTAGLLPEFEFNQRPCCERNPLLPKYPDCREVFFDDDPFYGQYDFKCINFVRSQECQHCTATPRQQLNMRTSFMDVGNLYANTLNDTLSLRSFYGGQLKMSADLLLIDVGKQEISDCGQRYRDYYPNDTTISCFHAGDTYANNNPYKISIVIAFAQQHNRIASMLQTINPFWSDEILFQEARRICGAQMQMITYTEFLPPMLGKDVMKGYELEVRLDGYTEYNPDVNPSTAIEFSSAGFRAVGHSIINGRTYKTDFNGVKTRYELKNSWHYLPGFHNGSMDLFIRGMITEPMEAVDIFIDDVVRLFGEKIAFNGPKYGTDFVVVDLMRARDHGVASYTTFRRHCFNDVILRFSDLADVMSSEAIRKLESMYKSPEDIDLYIGILFEYPLKGGLVGPTAACIWGIQFYRFKFGDRYYFEHEKQAGSFTRDQLKSIKQTTLAKILCENSPRYRKEKIQKYVMRLPSYTNPEVPCSSLPDIDIYAWQEIRSDVSQPIPNPVDITPSGQISNTGQGSAATGNNQAQSGIGSNQGQSGTGSNQGQSGTGNNQGQSGTGNNQGQSASSPIGFTEMINLIVQSVSKNFIASNNRLNGSDSSSILG